METEKLTDSLRIACHQPGGKKSISPSSKTALIATGTTVLENSHSLSASWERVGENTSRRDVLLSVKSSGAAEEAWEEYGEIAFETLGGASQTVLRPMTWASQNQSKILFTS